jgi:uncharacterized protein (DUF1684 family)
VNADDGPAALVETVWLDETDGWQPVDGTIARPVFREGRAGMRIFDPARAATVAAIDAFPPSAEWVIEGRFDPLPDGAVVAYGYALESAARDTVVAGILRFELAGREYETRPLGDDDSLLLVFADLTTGSETKPPGRFLDVARPSGGAGEVQLDFNRAYLPPCAFSDEFNCPLPPPAHRLAVAVTAGETFASFR